MSITSLNDSRLSEFLVKHACKSCFTSSGRSSGKGRISCLKHVGKKISTFL